MNTIRTAVLMAALTGIFVAVGYVIGGQSGMLIAFAIAAAMNFIAYWNSDKMVLAMYRAQEVDESSSPDLIRMVKTLSGKAEIPMPRVYIAENPQPNAFATGRNPEHAAICFTTGILERLSPEELAGVTAHELSHVKNRDTLTMTITATIAGAISMLANFALFMGGRDRNNPLGIVGIILVIVVAPIAAMLVQMAISRAREYDADKTGAEVSGRPLWLASALGKIQDAAHQIENDDAERNPATAHMFIINPLSGRSIANLFSTHPPVEERIARLEAMAGQMGQAGQSKGPWG